jgi:cell division protein ZapA
VKQVEVSILGQVYILACPDGGEALLASAVAAVDKEMTAIREAGRVKARERIAVLAALNLAYLLAERGHAGVAAGAPASPSAAASNDTETIDIDALLRRVDDALASDGQLL